MGTSGNFSSLIFQGHGLRGKEAKHWASVKSQRCWSELSVPFQSLEDKNWNSRLWRQPELMCQAYQKTEMARNQPELLVVSRWHGVKNLSSESAKEKRSWVTTSGFPLGYLKTCLVFDGTKLPCPTLPAWKKLKVQPGLVQFLICSILHSNKNKIFHETGPHETLNKNSQ